MKSPDPQSGATNHESGGAPLINETTISPVINNLIANMVEVEGGTFIMGGTPKQEENTNDDDKNTPEVTLSSFSIGRYEVTQEEWEAVMGKSPSFFDGARLPKEYISWDDCQEFIQKLNAVTGMNFRLPTEAEWEFAARGGNKSKGFKYSGSDDLGEVAWYFENSGLKTHQVGTKSPNELGLYDMSGNVMEWCVGWYWECDPSSQTDSNGDASGNLRVVRGGSWDCIARNCLVFDRIPCGLDEENYNIGFRLAL